MSAAPPRDEQRARPFRAVGFMRGYGHQVDAERGKIDAALADTLRGIDMHPRLPDRAQSSVIAPTSWITPVSLFTCMTDTSTVSGRRRSDALRLEDSVGIRLKIRDAPAAPLELLARIEHRLVLRARRDDVPSGVPVVLCRAENREVVGLGGPGGEHDISGLRADRSRHLRARRLDGCARRSPYTWLADPGLPNVPARVKHSAIRAATSGATGVVAA